MPSSKSESNRLLILQKLSEGKIRVENLSQARDTAILASLLEQNASFLDADDAGTAYRFLTTYIAISGRNVTLTGSERMKQRPIGDLVYALRSLGAKIQFVEKEGFPPLSFHGFHYSGINEVEIRADISSQFITALMLVAPTLPNGLTIHIAGEIASDSYLQMTVELLRSLEIDVDQIKNSIRIPHQNFKSAVFRVESDWSSAGYWFAMAALSKNADLVLEGLKGVSFQGDSIMRELSRKWGLEHEITKEGIRVIKSGQYSAPALLETNLSSTPDLAQTLLVLCACSGTEARFTGLKSLKLKESDRLMAMQSELKKVGLIMEISPDCDSCFLPGGQVCSAPDVPFETYKDHRMAMALSIFSMKFPIEVREHGVVRKSYPEFWEDVAKLGFSLRTKEC